MSLLDAKTPPVIGLGTLFGLPGDVSYADIQTCIEHGIEAGYRHIDTAHIYQTEVPVGRAVRAKIQEGVIKREDIFITSKLNYTHTAPEDIAVCVKESLRNLDLDYIDLYLIHFPFACTKPDDPVDAFKQLCPYYEENDYTKIWKILEGFVQEGVLKSIGVSNFNARQVQDILDMCTIKPLVNQCEIHLYLQNKQLRKYCTDRGVMMEAYAPLGQLHPFYRPTDWASPLTDQVVLELAEKYQRTPGQIALRFLIQQHLIVIPFSSKPTRLRENFQIFDFEITTEDMKKLESVDRHQRGASFEKFKDHKDYQFHDPY